MSVQGQGLRLGQLLDLTIDKNVYRGRGLGRVGGQVVLVPRAHGGDRIRVRVQKVRRGFAEAALVEVLEPAPARRRAPCPHAASCGGCAYQEIDYGQQLRVKESVLRESLVRASVPDPGPIPVRASPERGWRMRATLHFGRRGDALLLGLRREGSRRLVDVEDCLQLSPTMNTAARALREALAAMPTVARSARDLDLLESPGGEALVAVLGTTLRPRQAQALGPLGVRTPGLTGFGVRCLDRLVWLHGQRRITADILGLGLRAGIGSFFQANRFLLEPLAQAVRDLVPDKGGRILDLYAGVGLFALPLAARQRCDVIAVEAAEQAAEDARANTRRAGLGHVQVLGDDVGRALASLAAETDERIVLDPPRSGAGPGVVDQIAARAPSSVVYVSCDPPTLGRDLARFACHGYQIDAISLFDLFPDTFHLETVVRLRAGRAS